MQPRILLALGFLAVAAPPVGIPLLIAYVVVTWTRKEGGLETRIRMAGYIREEPWLTGDPEKDAAETARRVALMEARR